jgi:hypothetical protein
MRSCHRASLAARIGLAAVSTYAGNRGAQAAESSFALGAQFQHSDVDLIETDAFDAGGPFQGMSLGLSLGYRKALDERWSLGLRGSAGMTAPGSYVLASQLGYVIGGDAMRVEVAAEGGLHGFSGFGPGFPMFTTMLDDPVVTVPFVGGGVRTTRTGKRGSALAAFVGRDLQEKRATARWRVLTAERYGHYEVGGWFFGFAIQTVWEIGAKTQSRQ